MEFNFAFMGSAFIQILPAVPNTLMISFLTIVSGMIIAIFLAYVRFYNLIILKNIANFYVSFFRGTPIMMHFFLVYYGLPQFIDPLATSLGWQFRASAIPLDVLAIFALSFSASAFFAEILRSGFSSVNKGEIEAAYDLGMTPWQIMRRVIIPQALAINVPNIGSRCIAILQGSSLAFWISVLEITAKANLVAANTYQFMEAFIAVAAIYWILAFVMERVIACLEVRVGRSLGRGLVQR
ncbi:amino acid ABC transporter permease [Pectobacterium sp. B1J-3]|uniref:amino acid ABC transporter permease n=1 Tax=Pectobacterium sp. B1J-3 TaxID=3385371 RepID=UPI003905C164